MLKKDFPYFVRISLITFLIIFIVLYAYSKTRSIIFGVRIELISPKDGEVIPAGIAFVEGFAEHATVFKLNGREILIDPKGYFKEPLIVPVGYSILLLEATDKFGKSAEEIIRIAGYENTIPETLENNNL